MERRRRSSHTVQDTSPINPIGANCHTRLAASPDHRNQAVPDTGCPSLAPEPPPGTGPTCAGGRAGSTTGEPLAGCCPAGARPPERGGVVGGMLVAAGPPPAGRPAVVDGRLV